MSSALLTHFRQSILGALIATTVLQAALQIDNFGKEFIGDFRFWATILNIGSLAVISYIQYTEHWRSRQPNGVVLIYWLMLLVAYAVKLRSLVSQQLYRKELAYFVVFTACLLYTSPSPRDGLLSRMPSSA